MEQHELAALLREKLIVTGDGNVLGKDNTVNVAKQEAGDYAIQIGHVVNVTLSLDELHGLLASTIGSHPFSQATPRSVDSATLAAAQEQLAALPLDAIPNPAPLPPGSRMPLSRNPLFVGRQADLQELASALKAGETAAIGQVEIAAATGLGGIGKTQLASEFVHRYGQFFSGGVFWLSFADPGAISAQVVSCGGPGHLNLRPDFGELSLDEQVQLVLAAWQSPLPRLLVFDNCEDPVLLAHWRPPTGSARVLVTSRRAEWEVALGVRSLPLGVLSRAESMALLRQHRPDLAADNADLNAIAEELGDLPLALHLAGSYLARYRHAVTLAMYLAQLRQPNLLQHHSMQGGGFSPTGHEGHVARTFALSYGRLNPADKTDEVALALLARAAYFAPGELIPRDLLRTALGLPQDHPEAAMQVEDGLTRLLELGLLEGALRLHRLLAVFVRGIMGGTLADAAQSAVEAAMLEIANQLNLAGFPASLLALQPHMRCITKRAYARNDEQAASLCNSMGYHLVMIGDYVAARHYLERALDIRQQVLGKDHLHTASSLNNLGYLFQQQGDLANARLYHEQALTIRLSILGETHPDTATSLNNLGHVLQSQGNLVEAQPCLERALAIRREVFGETHPITAQSLNNLGRLLHDQGDLVKARAYLEQALAIRLKVVGRNHPSTATNLNNLGGLLQTQGDLTGAQRCYEQALAITEQTLGKTHPDTAGTLNNLGSVFKAQGNLTEAQKHYERALAIRQEVLGDNHPDTAQSLNNMGGLFLAQGNPAEARSYYEKALTIRLKTLGKTHPDTAISLSNMSAALWALGDLAEARSYLEQVSAIFKQTLGKSHPNTAQSLNNLGVLHLAQGDFAKARKCFKQALRIWEATLPPGHPHIEMGRRQLADLAHGGKGKAIWMQIG